MLLTKQGNNILSWKKYKKNIGLKSRTKGPAHKIMVTILTSVFPTLFHTFQSPISVHRGSLWSWCASTPLHLWLWGCWDLGLKGYHSFFEGGLALHIGLYFNGFAGVWDTDNSPMFYFLVQCRLKDLVHTKYCGTLIWFECLHKPNIVGVSCWYQRFYVLCYR